MTTNQEAPKRCKCGCRAQVANNYRPGHDARHLATVVRRVRDVAEDVKAGRKPSYELSTVVHDGIASLPTEALREKAVKRLVAMGWLLWGRQARSIREQELRLRRDYGRPNMFIGTVWNRTFGGRVALQYRDEETIFGLLAAAGWDAESVGTANA